MFGSILHRLIFKELIKVFLLSLIGLTGLFLLAGIVQEASQRGLSLGQLLGIMPLLIPNTLPYTIPATTLFATCVVYGRMSHDNEIIVLKSAGVNLFTILKPALALGLLSSSVTMGLYYHLIPYTQQLMRAKLISEGEEMLYGVLKRERSLRFPSLPYVMYVREVQGRRLIDVIFKRRVKKNGVWVGYDLIARAREATLRVDIQNGEIQVDMNRCVAYEEGQELRGEVLRRSYPVPLPDQLFGREPRTRPMALTWDQLLERQIELENEKQQLQEELVENNVRISKLSPGDPAYTNLSVHGLHLNNKIKESIRNRLHVDAELQMRPAIALGCLCFVMIGVPVGIYASRADYLSSFVICFLPTIFVYYPLLLAGSNMAKEGKLAMHVGCWAADVILWIAALFLIWRVMRR